MGVLGIFLKLHENPKIAHLFSDNGEDGFGRNGRGAHSKAEPDPWFSVNNPPAVAPRCQERGFFR
jgi:hypothetical protein